MILLVVDTQKGCFNENLYAFEIVKNNIKKLIAVAREDEVDLEFMRALDFVSFISLLYQFSTNIQFVAVCIDL